MLASIEEWWSDVVPEEDRHDPAVRRSLATTSGREGAGGNVGATPQSSSTRRSTMINRPTHRNSGLALALGGNRKSIFGVIREDDPIDN